MHGWVAAEVDVEKTMIREEEDGWWVVGTTDNGVDDNRAGSESACVRVQRNVSRASGEGCVANAQNASRIARRTVAQRLPGFRFSLQWGRRVLKTSAAAGGVEADGVAGELEGEDRDYSVISVGGIHQRITPTRGAK